MVAPLILATALQAVQPQPTATVCSLVTPGNDLVGFQVLAGVEPDSQARVVPTQGSTWPRQSTVAMGNAGGNQFAFAGDAGFVLEIERARDRQVATLSRRGAQRGSVPVAYGFCDRGLEGAETQARAPGTGQAQIDTDISAFDPQHWPEDRCGMLLSDGRRLPFQFMWINNEQVAMASPRLWNGQPITARSRSAGSFNGRNGLSGAQEFVVREREALAVRLIRFRNLGDPSAQGQTAYAICGHTGIERRPTPQ